MKIFYFTPTINNPGGMERTLILKVNFLVDILGYDVTIITCEKEKYNTSFFKLSQKVKLLNLDIDFNSHYNKAIFIKGYLHRKKLFNYQKKIDFLLKSEKPDICISLFGKEVDFLYKIKDGSKKIGEIHFAKDIRAQFINSRNSNILFKLFGNFRTWQLERAAAKFDCLVVLTEQDFKEWNLKKCICIPNANPIITGNFSTCEEKRVIAVGRLDPQKGFDRLIEAWKIVYEEHPDWKLAIYGEGYQRKELQSSIDRLNLNHVITLHLPTKNITEEYLKSSIYVMSSRYEGFGMVLIEAMACGLPCISYDCKCGPKDIISHKKDGLLIPEGNIIELANSINYLIINKEIRLRMSKNAIEKSKQYDLDKIISTWDSLFQSILR